MQQEICLVIIKRLALALSIFLAAIPATRAQESLATAVEQHLVPAVKIVGKPASERRLADAMETMHVPGISIAVLRDGRLVWAHAYGLTAAGGKRVTPETPFQAGSISKSVAALAILKLASTGEVSLDAPVNAYLESWKLPDSSVGKAQDVTLRRLLAHTGGTNVHGFPGYRRGGPVPSLGEILDGTPPSRTPPIRITSKPGAAWQYSGGGYVIAQQLVADVTGTRFADWAANAWLRPAGMTSSSFDEPYGPKDGVTLGHGADGVAVAGDYHLYPEAAAAGLWTTPSDLGRALIALRRSIKGEQGALLPQAMARLVLEPVLPGHAIGFDVGGKADRWIAKGGDTEGFAGYLVFYPESGNGAVVMTNGAQGATLARDVMRAIAISEKWPDFGPRVRHSTPIPKTLLDRLPGTYTYRESNHFTIAREGASLTISSPGEQPERLHRDRSGKFFTLSQDVAFVFDTTTGAGKIELGDSAIAFRKEDK